MARMINISGEAQTLTIAGNPGTRPLVVKLEPGQDHDFADGYCVPVKAARRTPFPSVIERMSARRTGGGLPEPTVVPVGSDAHKEWLAKQGKPAPVRKRKRKPAPPARAPQPEAPPPTAEVEELTEGEED